MFKERDFSLILIIICIALILFLGIREKKRHTRRLNKIPLRININGIRGKSTITRMIYSILREDQYHVIGKTTGTDAECCIGLQRKNIQSLENHKAPT